jgi:hypothetical protein
MLEGAGDGPVRGETGVGVSRHGFGEFGMLVDRDWRGRGAGSEGRRIKQYRRDSGELWDSIVMGLQL